MADKNPYAPGILSKLVFALRGAGGAYNPLTNTVSVPDNAWADDGFDHGANVVAHENEHKRQFNYPNNISSPDAVRIANNIDDRVLSGHLKNLGYSRSRVPAEVLSNMAGANTTLGSKGTVQAQAPHPATHLLNDEEKLWVLENQQKHLTDQDYLNNILRFGSSNANRIQRVKAVAGDIYSNLTTPFSKSK